MVSLTDLEGDKVGINIAGESVDASAMPPATLSTFTENSDE